MTSMRFPRANLSGAAAYEDSGHSSPQDARDHAAKPAASGQVVNLRGAAYMQPKAGDAANSDQGGFVGPTWQEYFFLAPNVRFTRTPEYDRVTRRSPQGDDGKGAQGTVEASADAAPAPAAAPSSSHGPARPAPSRPAAAMPARPAVEEPAGIARQAPSAIQRAPEAARPAAQPVAAPVERPRAGGARWSYLSDHAFFEFGMPFLAERLARARPADIVHPAVAVPAQPLRAAAMPAQPASPALPVAEITARYRVIECHANAAPAPVPPAAAAALPRQAEAACEPPAPETGKADAAPQDARADSPAPAAEAAPPAPARSVEITMPPPRAPSLPMAGKVAAVASADGYELPSEELLQLPPDGQGFYMSQERLEQNADLLESVLEDFGVRGEIIHVRPGPVVTLYEFEPAPGVKSSRVIGLADDIARSMSAISARVAVVPGRNVIGIELPNETRETVYFRELICSDGFRNSSAKLALGLGKTIGGEPVIAELAKMPHLLVAGTTGSGKSVAINTMILSLLYRLKPEECRLIMVDPKMLELSIYDGIPHLLTPVVTDPKKAVTALKWAVREMEDRYRKMARLGVRNIDGYNQRAAAARDKGEVVVMQVQTGFEKGTGEPLFEEQEIDLTPMPYIVVIVDEMADLMMVAGKEIEGAIQRLAQMARAAGIHLIMATQRPSVDVITGTIKANFPTRISFQVTSKIDSRTILGEQGAEQLLGQGDMLHMAGGGRIMRVHGPFVSDEEVEQVVAHLKAQGRPEYLETVTADEDEQEPEVDDGPVFDKGAVAADDPDALYEEAVKVVMRDKKCSTSYIQRRLGVGYNRAASLVERMEKEGLVGAPNHVGKREILLGKRDHSPDREELD
ncbi:DNA translocase FtsK [Aquamicrobium terrae]